MRRVLNYPVAVLALSLFLVAACEPWTVDEIPNSGTGNAISSGTILLQDPPRPSIQLDFSMLPQHLDSLIQEPAFDDELPEVDLSFDGFVLEAPHGIAHLGTYPACFNARGSSIDTRSYFETRLLEYGVTAPEGGYSRAVPFPRYDSCRLFAVKTAEGHYALFLHVATSISAYDRMLFFWIYREDGKRVFLSTDPARLQKGRLNALAWSPDSKTLAQAASAGIYLDDAEALKQQSYIHTESEVHSLAFHPVNGTLAWGGCDPIVRLVDVSTGDQVLSLDGHTGCVTHIVFSPDGGILATGTSEGSIRVWDAETGRSLRRMVGLEGRVLMDLTFTPDALALAAAFMATRGRYDTSTLRVWEVKTGELILDTVGPDPDNLLDAGREHPPGYVNPGPALGVDLSPDGLTLAAFNWNGTVQLWDVSSGQLLNALQARVDRVTKIAFNFDGSILAIGSESGDIALQDAKTGELVQILEGGIGGVANIALSPDGNLLASGLGLVSLWDISSGKLLGNLK